MKQMAAIISIAFFVFCIAFVYFAVNQEQEFAETLLFEPNNITKLTLKTPYGLHEKTTENQEEIQQFIDYFGQFSYIRLNSDESAFMPMHATIIYLYQGDKVNFIVPYEISIMVNKQIYKVKKGPVAKEFINQFYDRLD